MPQCVSQEPEDRYIGANWTAKCWLTDQQAQEEYVSAIA
jgi:hypothetical protein